MKTEVNKKEKNNFLKYGISLIVLVITIIVIGILATAIIIGISNSNIMTKAKESTFKSDMRQFQEMYSIWYASTAAENKALPGLTINVEYNSDPNGLYQEIFGSYVPTKYREGLKVENGRVVYYTADDKIKALLPELGMSPNALQITNILTNCTNSNSAESIEYGETYDGVLTPTPGYTIQNVCITMGGVDITSTAYTLSTGAISISNVTGKLVINATTEQGTYVINNSLTHATTNNSNTQVTGTTSYSAVLSPNAGYTLTGATVSITMGGVDITSTAYTSATGTISISSVTGNIAIVATMQAGTYAVTNNLTGCTSNNAVTSATGATSYMATLTASAGKQLSSVTVTMGGVDVTSTYYNTSTHVVSIVSVTGNIVITATTSTISYTITNNLTGCISNNSNTNIEYGSSYTATLTASTGYTLTGATVTVTVGGSTVSGAYNSSTGVISLSNVTGNIVITATMPTSTYTVTYTLSNVTKSTGATSVNHGASLSATVAASSGYNLPDSITITIGGSNYTGFTYTQSTGTISIPTGAITGNVVITVTGDVVSTAITPIIIDTSNSQVTLTKTNVKDYYGMKVSDYTAGGATYRLFYVDFDGKFGTAGTIYLKADYDASRSTWGTYYTVATSTLVEQMNPLWAAERGTSKKVTWHENEKGAAYLCDTAKWTTYLDNTKANFAIGSPSVEMLAESYNQVPHTVGNNTVGVVYSDTDTPGYKYTVNGGSAEFSTDNNTIDNSGYHNMYAPSNGIYWLASPSSYGYEGIICAIDSEPVNLQAVRWGYGAWQVSECDYGLCPVVSLKSTFKPTLVAD